MALFKILKGNAANLPSEKTEGYCYVTTDTNRFYIDISGDKRIELTVPQADIAGSVAWSNVTDKPSTYAPTSHTHNMLVNGSNILNISNANTQTGFGLYGSPQSGGGNYYLYFEDNGAAASVPTMMVYGRDATTNAILLNSSNYTSYAATVNHTHAYLPLTGGTVTGPVILSCMTDLIGTYDTAPALRIGDINGFHIAFDPNEIHAKGTATTVAPLYLNNDGGQVVVGKGGIQNYGNLDVSGTFNSMVKMQIDSVTSGTKAATRTALIIYGPTYGNDSAYIKTPGKLSYGDPCPQIIFGNTTDLAAVQKAALIFTDHDTIKQGVSLSLVSTESKCSFIAPQVYGAVWNDYAEYRSQKQEIKPGYCAISNNDGILELSTELYQACDGIVSDTFGFAIGETDEAKTPLAVAGRVLAYCFGNREDYQAGDTVCAGPGGLVYKMTREEICKWPDRVVGIVSEIPQYETWGTGNVEVDGRIWIKVK